VLDSMINSFDKHGAEVKTVIKLVAQKFDISRRLARTVILWRKAMTKSSKKVKDDPKVPDKEEKSKIPDEKLAKLSN